MKTATYASSRTANAVSRSLNAGLKLAFRSGAVMGLTVVGLGLLDISIWYIVLKLFVSDPNPSQTLVTITTTMLTFGMGASTQALFARVGGGIYTKAADVGADIVGKSKRISLKMTLEIQLRLQTMSVIMSVMLPVWVPTFMSHIVEPSLLRWRLVPLLSSVTP